MTSKIPFGLLIFVAAFLPACNAEVVVDGTGGGDGATSSSTSSTTSTGTTGQGGAGGGTGETCPLEPPLQLGACNLPEGQTCSYGECCPLVFQCTNGQWMGLTLDCPAPMACPPAPPAEGSPCIHCGVESPCFYACNADLTTSVRCGSDNLWHLDTPPCPTSIACGNTVCKAGEVCVKKAGGPGYSYQCAPDPCAPDPLSCACAEALCGGSPFICSGASGAELTCDCPVCQ